MTLICRASFSILLVNIHMLPSWSHNERTLLYRRIKEKVSDVIVTLQGSTQAIGVIGLSATDAEAALQIDYAFVHPDAQGVPFLSQALYGLAVLQANETGVAAIRAFVPYNTLECMWLNGYSSVGPETSAFQEVVLSLSQGRACR